MTMEHFLSSFLPKNKSPFLIFPFLFLCLSLMANGQSSDSTSYKPITTSDGTVYEYVDHMPEFPGGQDALIQYLGQHLRYPGKARRKQLQGIVIVQFVVGYNGKIENVKTVGEKLGGGLEKEAIRVVKRMPNWFPGTQKGKKVRVQYSLPIRFKLTP